jgi:hypothetical protein
MTLATPDGEVTIDNGTWNPPNGDENFHIEILDADAADPPAQGVWTLDIEGTSVPTGVDALLSEADMWLYFWTIGPPPAAPKFITGLEEAEIVASPATADSVIAVASYVTKNQWQSIDTNMYQYDPPVTVGAISPFSSVGPRRDGVTKPDISAPGQGIFSTLSSDASVNPIFIHPDGVHFLTQGTSMASPHIAGVVALIFDSLGSMYTDRVMHQLFNSARADGHTGKIPNSTWGWGKVDADGATQVITPILIQGLSASTESWGVLLSWSSPGDLRADEFRVFRALDIGIPPSELLASAELAGEIDPDAMDVVFEDRALVDSGRYAYWVQAVFQGEPEVAVGPIYAEWTRVYAPPVVLHPASPNPFRPNTTLQLELAQSADVSVEILDPMGRRVRTLSYGTLDGGIHKLVWDGRDDKGREAASGLYFARVKAAQWERVGRLVLIR